MFCYAEQRFVLFDKPIDTMRMPLSIMCIRVHMSEFQKTMFISLKIASILANSENSDEMICGISSVQSTKSLPTLRLKMKCESWYAVGTSVYIGGPYFCIPFVGKC